MLPRWLPVRTLPTRPSGRSIKRSWGKFRASKRARSTWLLAFQHHELSKETMLPLTPQKAEASFARTLAVTDPPAAGAVAPT